MTIEENIKELKSEDTKEVCQTRKIKINRQLQYDVYDKRVYLAKRRSDLIVYGYLRNEQSTLDMNLPNELLYVMFTFYYDDKVKELLRIGALPSIQEGQTDLFIEKLESCHTILDFSVSDMEKTYESAKQTKRTILNETVEFISSKSWISNHTLSAVIAMISHNLFRSLPHNKHASPYINSLAFVNDDVFETSENAIAMPDNENKTDNDSNDDYERPDWAHLELIYDITWRLINTQQFTPDMMQQHLNEAFLTNLVQLFASQQQKERQYLMMILHKVYGRCMTLRPFILKIISDYLYQIIYGNQTNIDGVVELLQIICAIMPGLKKPVKNAWKQLLRNVLVPLYKSYALNRFWECLTPCCVTYIAKDISGANVILGGLLKFWPQQSPQKEEIFIMAIVNIINAILTHNDGFVYEHHKAILIKIMHKLSQCMLSSRQTVAQRAINVLKERAIQDLFNLDRMSFFPIIMNAFYHNAKNTNMKLRNVSKEVQKMYRSLDNQYWKKYWKHLNKQEKKGNKSQICIRQDEEKGIDPYQNIQQKVDKLAFRKQDWREKLTKHEKLVRRRHNWKIIQAMAEKNMSNRRGTTSMPIKPPMVN